MLGVGRQWAHQKQNGKTRDFSLQNWPGLHVLVHREHRFGWYLEPAYDYSFAGGHVQSIGMSAGLLIGIK
jgi:hypothetical protein